MRVRLDHTGARLTTATPSIGLIAAIVCAFSVTGCSRELSPTAPSTPPAVVTPPAPVESNVTLKGRVTEAAPTTVMGVWDATVTVTDGSDSWSSEKTFGGGGQGTYAIPSLKPGRYEATVAANGFVTARRTLTMPADAATDFPLLPVPTTMSDTFENQISDTDGTCSDGTQPRPCRIVAIPIHNAGTIDATLTWKPAAPAVLSVTLFQKGQAEPIARSTSTGPASQHLVANTPGGAVSELRITYLSGTGPATYTMRVVRPN
jgi:carboxypeptidase family protein